MKKILFITNSLGLGGSEKAMAEMVNRMDLEKYDITILALISSDNYVSFDSRIKIVNGWSSLERFTIPAKKYLASFYKYGRVSDLIRKITFAIKCKLNYKNEHISKFFWSCFSKSIDKIDTFYDVVIGYGQGNPTYFLKDKVNTDRKIAWLNTDLQKAHYDIKYVRQFYNAADFIVTDSENGRNNIRRIYPDMYDKTKVFLNILDVEGILAKSKEDEEVLSKENNIKILSIGRLVEAKAFHLAVEAANILYKKGIDFKWYIIGRGALWDSLEKQINDYGLKDRVILLGLQTNPYKYIRNCDIYVQTSIYEGSCITVNEAMIFNKPIVSTNFPAIYEKIIHGENGLISEMNGESIAENIQKLIEEEDLRERFGKYLAANPIDYEGQMKMLDEILQ